MKRLITALILFAMILMLAACQPQQQQPVFTPGLEVTATPLTFAPEPQKVAATLPGRIAAFDINPDQSVIAFGTSKGVLLYSLTDYSYLQTLSEGMFVSDLEWSPDGKSLAVSLQVSFLEYGEAHLDIYDTGSWKKSETHFFYNDLRNERFLDLAWSPDGTMLAITTDVQGVIVLNVKSGKEVSHQMNFASSVQNVAWSPDGSRLAATNDLAYGIRRWKVSDDDSVRLYDQRNGGAMAIAWSPDGQRIASGHVQGTVCLWSVATNLCDGFIQAHRSAVFSLAWSPDGEKLATGAGVVRIWDTQTGKLLEAFGEYDDYRYEQIEWLKDGQKIVTLQDGLYDMSITAVRFWDVAAGINEVEFTGGQE